MILCEMGKYAIFEVGHYNMCSKQHTSLKICTLTRVLLLFVKLQLYTVGNVCSQWDQTANVEPQSINVQILPLWRDITAMIVS